MAKKCRTRFEAAREKRAAVGAAEAEGSLVDGREVREALVAKVRSGEMTLAEAQSALRKLQSQARRSGLPTRAGAFNAG